MLKTLSRLFCFTSLALTMAACAPANTQSGKAEQTAQGDETARVGDIKRAMVTSGSIAFGLDLYRTLARGSDNLFFSPIGLSVAFGMVEAGAAGQTRTEIDRVLHYPTHGAALHAALGGLSRDTVLKQQGREVRMANRVWVQNGYPLEPDYERTLTGDYAAAPETADIRGDAPGTSKRINAWIDQATNGRIRNALQPGDLRNDHRLVLVNAIWMLADWQYPFAKPATREQPFRHADGSTTNVPMMAQRYASRRLLRGSGFQAIELPYRGGELSMLVFLPDTPDGLPALERQLPAQIEEWTAALLAKEPENVDLFLPRFELSMRYDLPPPMRALGMNLAFSSAADFTGITRAERLMLDKAVHQAFVRVDEEGTEAAAATMIAPMPVSAPPPAVVTFRADHPFFFIVHDRRTGAALFMGRLTNP